MRMRDSTILRSNRGGGKMRAQNLLLGLVLFFFVSCGVVFAQPFEMIEIGTGGDPHWSPDGKEIAFVYMGSLFVADADGGGEPQKIAELPPSASGFTWLDSNEFLVWGRDYWREEGVRHKGNWIEAIARDGGKRSVVRDEQSAKPTQPHEAALISGLTILNDGTVGYYETPAGVEETWGTENKVFRIIREGKLPPDSAVKQLRAVEHYTGIYSKGKQVYDEPGIWLESIDGTINKKVSSCRWCSFPILSPDETKILVNGGSNPECVISVLDLQGNEICVGKECINSPDPFDTTFIEGCVDGMPVWSPDGQKIAYKYHRYKLVIEGYDAVDIIELESEIYIENADGADRIQLTNTPDKAEAGPVWSPDGSRIACTDGHTARIYAIKLK
jgi:hypothetical protein